MDAAGDAADLAAALEKLAAPLAESGRAAFAVERVTPEDGQDWTVYKFRPAASSAMPVSLVQQYEAEISLFVGPPGDPGSLTANIYDEDRASLLDEVTRYMEAVVAGRCGATVKPGTGKGRVTFVLATGEQRPHYYGLLWTRGIKSRNGWKTYHFSPY